MNPVIGKTYLVPCVFMDIWGNEYVPINGPHHEDAAVIGFTPYHWHIDWRFASKTFWKRQVALYGTKSGVHGKVICSPDLGGRSRPVVMRRKQCQREMPPYPRDQAHWLPALEAKYSGSRLSCMRCPHKGISLEGMPVADGLITCPGHGLRFRAATGEMVREAQL